MIAKNPALIKNEDKSFLKDIFLIFIINHNYTRVKNSRNRDEKIVVDNF